MKLSIPTIEKTVEKMLGNADRYAAVYARESNKGYKSGLESQVITNKRYAAENNLVVYDVYQEFISASQKNYKMRSEFLRLIDDAKKGYFKKIIVTKRDRLTRRFEDYIEIKNTFKELGVEVLYSNDVQLKETKDYASNFIENLIMAIAELEPQNIRERILAGNRAKRAARIYDKKAAFGHYRDKVKNEYVKNGVKAEIVRDIFDIYLDMDEVTNSGDVIRKLKIKALGRNEEYVNEVNKIDTTDIMNIISRPIYAGLQTKYIEYRYSDFKIECDEEPVDLKLKYFHDCVNVERILKPFEWLAAANKWIENNGYKKVASKKQKKEEKILDSIFYCKECCKNIKLKGAFFQCETKECVKVKRNKFIKVVLEKFIQSFIFKDEIDPFVEDVIRELNVRKEKCKKALIKSISNQSYYVEMYLARNDDLKLKESIINANYEQTKIKKEIDELEDKIIFLKEKFRTIILPIIHSKYVSIIIDEIEKNQSSMLEMLLYKNIRELRVDGKIIEIKQQ